MEQQPIPYTVAELRDYRMPRTWFRRKLVERSSDELKANPQLEMRLTLCFEEAQILNEDLQHRRISQRDYDAGMRKVRMDIGNILYR